MRPTELAVKIVLTCLTAVELAFPGIAAAQSYRPDFIDRAPQSPAAAMSLSPSAIDALNYELSADFRAMDAFGGRRHGVDQFGASSGNNRPRPWTVYGRFGLLNFQNRIEEQRLADTNITWRRTGPSLTGRYYIGIHRQFW
jgi:hypothetical protein